MVFLRANILQLRIGLEGIKPSIWRRIEVPETYTFWELHVAIQDVMPWEDYHLHQFEVRYPGTREKVIVGRKIEFGVEDERQTTLKQFLCTPNDRATYLYDFGLGWAHSILLEGIVPESVDSEYPRCTGGKNPCFPEDAEGERIEVEFDPTKVKFKNPEEYWNANLPRAAC